LGCFFRVSKNCPDLRVPELQYLKVDGFLGLTIEPQEWSNSLHQFCFALMLPVSQWNFAFRRIALQ
jgi:hypothetical protein